MLSNLPTLQSQKYTKQGQAGGDYLLYQYAKVKYGKIAYSNAFYYHCITVKVTLLQKIASAH